MDCTSKSISVDPSIGKCLCDVPMQGDPCEKKFACQKMPLNENIAVFLVQRGIGMEQGEEWR